MNCSVCGVEVKVACSSEGTNHYVPADILLWHDNYKVPFHCEMCGAIQFPWKPMRDLVFLHPIPVKGTYADGGQVVIPDNYRQFYKKGEGVILATGPGYWDTKEFHPTNKELKVGSYIRYNPEVPWSLPVIGNDGKEHDITICGSNDIWWVEDGIDGSEMCR